MSPGLTVPFRWLRAVTFRAVSYLVLGCGAIGTVLAAGPGRAALVRAALVRGGQRARA
jgi:hypothetical protein